MKPFAKYITGIPYGIFSAMMVTIALFLSLPLLTQLQPVSPAENNFEPILIDSRKPPPTPPEEREAPEKQSPIVKEFVNKTDQPKRVRPHVDIQRTGLLTVDMDGIPITIDPSIETLTPIPDPTYRPNEVDHQPVLLRSFPFQYPYLARRDNIEGWVTLRFVVDIDGSVRKVEAVAAEPVGIFEEAALKAVERYKFKPAIKNGDAVNCLMTQRIRFDLD